MKAPVRILPSQEFLCSILDYDPETGVLTWRHRPDSPKERNTRWAGKVAGTINKVVGVLISLDDLGQVLAPRVIWKMMTGVDPPTDIDHRDCNRRNNAWDNLRLATVQQNNFNRRKKSGKEFPKGVDMQPNGRFRAKTTFNKGHIYLGCFDTAEEAHQAYCKFADENHGEFARYT